MTVQAPAITSEEIITQIYRTFTRLAGEIALERSRNRVLMQLVAEGLDLSPETLDGKFRAEVEANLETYVRQITDPMLDELQATLDGSAGGCGGGCACGAGGCC